MPQPSRPAKINLPNIARFIQGWLRYIVFYLSGKSRAFRKVSSTFHLLSPEKQEQFKYRLQVMNPQCLSGGACVICGCETPQLQMIDDTCDGGCYPKMMDAQAWTKYKKDNGITV
jgi:hypothetical protein